MAAMVKTTLTAICVAVVLAVAYLTLSVVVLRPPRVNYPAWFAVAAIVVVATGLTLVALWVAAPVRLGALGGGAAVAVLGGWMIQQTLASPHFEGYALVLGALLCLQGGLTVVAFAIQSSTA
jgi:hypothetical protein